jgi:N-acetylglucosamine-6-phosphate deacetylase
MASNPLSSDFGALFGSAIGMREVFENSINLLTGGMEGVYCRWHPPLDLAEAVAAASRMCSANPASLLGLRDRGTLAVGQRADAVLVEIEGRPGSYEVKVCATWLG